MGPSLSSDQQRVMAPVRGIRPKVGRKPTVPHRADGDTIDPRVSEPMENPHSPAAVAEAEPALDPDEPSSMSQGLRVWPANHRSLYASAPKAVFPRSTAPASRSLFTISASSVGMRSL